MANPITIAIPHKLTRADAVARVTESVDRMKQQLGVAGVGQVRHNWTQNRLDLHAQTMGQVLTVRIHVNDHDLKIEVELPALLGAFADKIARRLRQEGTRLIEKK